jgi:DAK2 domain fusion protein YloV
LDFQFRTRIDGDQLLQAFDYAAQVIADHRDQLNAMNVFPVPDGDTGTNMSITVKSAVEAAHRHVPAANRTVDRIASSAAMGALMGARGNSGVILSQILRGFAVALEGRTWLDAGDTVLALEGATRSAYKAVIEPVEGTMLTVIGDASRAAHTASRSSANVLDIFDAAARGAAESLAHTPDLLDVLSRAHVVDAGGQGVAYILRAISNHLRGDLSEIQIGDANPIPNWSGLDGAPTDGHFDDTGYCTNFVIFGVGIDLDGVRSGFKEIGSSVVVVGDESLLKIHIHTERPDQALELALRFGSLDRVSIDNMDRQIDEIAAHGVAQSSPAVLESEIAGKHAVISFAAGPGLARALLSLGATTVLPVSDESAPAKDVLLRAIETAKAAKVLLIPTSPTILDTCTEVRALSGKSVGIAPSMSFAAAMTTLSAMSLTAELETNVHRASSVVEQVLGVEIATATEDGVVDGIQFDDGEVLGFVNGTLKAAHSDLESVLGAVLGELGPIDPDICTIFVGREVPSVESDSVNQTIEQHFPDAEIELIEGGQAYYRYIIAIE